MYIIQYYLVVDLKLKSVRNINREETKINYNDVKIYNSLTVNVDS